MKGATEKSDIIRDAITSTEVAEYLTAEHGYDLAVWKDGTVDTIQHNISFTEENSPIARISCPGIGNLDTRYFTEDFAEEKEDGLYYDILTGEIIGDGDIEDVITACCADGDVTDYMDDIVAKLIEDAEYY